MSDKLHTTRAIKVWADVDEGIADFVLLLNEILGIRTIASCQGTIGEGGAAPYEAHVMVTWDDDAARQRLASWRVEQLGYNFGYVYPNATEEWRRSIAAAVGCEISDIKTVKELLECNPVGACETHGRCWTHSEWAE